MPVESFRARELEFVLAPGLNLLVCPSAETLELVWEGVREALGPSGDDFVISQSDWRELSAICAWRPVGEVVVAAGMVGGRRLPAVKHRLRRELENLYVPKARAPVLNRALAELARVQKELKAIGDPAVRIAELEKQLDSLGSRADAARAQLERLEAERELFGRIVAALPELSRVMELEAERQRLAHVADFPRDGVDRLVHLKAELQRVEEKKVSSDRQAERPRPAGVRGPPPDALVDRISVLLDVHRLWDVQLRALPDRIDAVSRLRRELEQQIAKLEGGEQPTLDQTIASAAAALDEGRRCFDHRRLFSGTATAVRERVESEVRRLSSEAMTLSPTVSSAQVHAQLAALSELPALAGRVTEAENALATVQGQRDHLAARAPPRPRELLPLPAAIGLAALGAGVAVAAIVWGPGLWMVLGGTFGALALAGPIFGYSTLHRRHLARVEEWEKSERERQATLSQLELEATAAQQRVHGARRRLEEAERQAGCGHDAVRERQEARSHALQLLFAQVERREDIARQMEAYAALMSMVAQEEGRSRVDRHVAEARLSALERELAPTGESGAHLLLPLLKRRLTQLRVEEGALSADWKACARAGELLLQAARGVDVSLRELAAVPVALEALRESLAEHAERARVERAQVMEAALARAQLLGQRAGLAEAIRGLLRDGHAGDESEFTRHSLEAQRLDQVESQLRDASRLASDAAGMAVDALRRHLSEEGGEQAVTRKKTRLAERTTRLGGQLARLEQDRSRVATELEAWRRGDAVEALRKREGDLLSQADALLETWGRTRLALGLVERRTNAWRKQKREAVMQFASREFGRLTGGAFVHVTLAGPDEASMIVTDASLKQLRADELQPQHRSLLYLAFRLAALDELGEAGANVPLVFNGALTGFGPEDLGRIAETLSRMGEDRQVVVLTRQPLVRELFEAQGAHGVELDDLAHLETRSA